MTRIPDSFYDIGAMCALDTQRVFCGWGRASRRATPPQGAPGLYISDFFMTDDAPWYSWEWSAVFNRSDFALPEGESMQPDWEEPREEDFRRTFLHARVAFEEGTLSKVVPVVFEKTNIRFEKQLRARLIRRAIAAPPELYPYGFWSDEEGMIGATPEILVRVDSSRRAVCAALAGTRSAAGQFSEKDRYEHRLVVDYLEGELSQYGSVTREDAAELMLPGLTHLKTIVRLESQKTLDLSELIRRLHPTPALGGTPKSHALEFLAAEPFPRFKFGAPFAVRFPDGTGVALVAIRNVQWQGDSGFLGAGCGVVPQSELAAEWEELRLKRDAVHKGLGI